MNTNQSVQTKRLAGASILTAIAASLCCITPVLALIAGASGLASAFSWLEPARPYLMGVTVLVLGFAWYQKLKPRTKEEIECACEDDKPSFLQSKMFLGIVTVFAAVMLAFPLYAQIFFPKNEKQMTPADLSTIQSVEFKINGMTCNACEQHVKHEASKVNGVYRAEVSYQKGNAVVEFDSSVTSVREIEEAINSTGYEVTESKILSNGNHY